MSKKYQITKVFSFEASHKLVLDYKSPCQKIHGHSYKVEVTLESSSLDGNGMVMDFSELKVINDWVDENWDHSLIMSKHDPDLQKYKTDENVKLYQEFHALLVELGKQHCKKEAQCDHCPLQRWLPSQ